MKIFTYIKFKFYQKKSIGDQPVTDVWDFENEWSEGLCGCATNRGQCIVLFNCDLKFTIHSSLTDNSLF